jgi:hypothetical protein
MTDLRSRFPLRPVALAAAAVLSLVGPSARGAEPVRSATWKSTVTLSDARAGRPVQQAELWLADGRLRIADRTPGLPPTDYLIADGAVYFWEAGKTTGMKAPLALAARGGRPLHDYALRVAGLRSGGRALRSEKSGGRTCDVFASADPSGAKTTYWLAPDLADFPLRIEEERPEAVLPYRTRTTRTVRLAYENRDVKVGAKVNPERVAPPPGVRFEDASEVFTGPPRRPR